MSVVSFVLMFVFFTLAIRGVFVVYDEVARRLRRRRLSPELRARLDDLDRGRVT